VLGIYVTSLYTKTIIWKYVWQSIVWPHADFVVLKIILCICTLYFSFVAAASCSMNVCHIVDSHRH